MRYAVKLDGNTDEGRVGDDKGMDGRLQWDVPLRL